MSGRDNACDLRLWAASGVWCNWQHSGFWYRHSRFESWYPSHERCAKRPICAVSPDQGVERRVGASVQFRIEHRLTHGRSQRACDAVDVAALTVRQRAAN
jgi:hypothetical protein